MSALIPPPLREELKIRKMVQQGEVSYVIKEPDKQAYYHFSEAQYEMLELFDGEHDLTCLMELFNEQSEQYEFDLESLESLYDTCRDYQLLKRSRAEQNAALLELIREERKGRLLQAKGGLLLMRFHLVDPNAFFDRIIDHIRFMWSPIGFRVQAIFMILALFMVLLQSDRFVQDFGRVYLQTYHENGMGLWTVWVIALFAISLHECGHGLTCKHYGGDVDDMGFLLLCFQPCLYCNVNDAWLFEKKQHKIYVALAGVWVEMLLAAVSAIVWLIIDVSHPIGFIAYVLMTIGTATTLLVNLNPLLKFDGYYILTDMLEMQNLRQNAIAWFSWSLKHYIFRLETDPPFHPSPRERKIYTIYGSLVALYMTSILLLIAILGYGFISAKFGFLANLGFLYLVLVLMKKITGSWSETLKEWGKETLWSSQRRKIISLTGSGLAVLILLFWQPHVRIDSNGIVEADTHIVYATENGFVSYVGYNSNRHILQKNNKPLFVISSPELTLAQDQLSSSFKAVMLQQMGASVNDERNLNQRLSLEKSLLSEKQLKLTSQQDNLNIHAPAGEWMVDGLPPELMRGRYFQKGTPIVTLVAAKQRYIDVIVDQRDMYLLQEGDEGLIRFAGVAPSIYEARIKQIASLAKSEGIEQSFTVRMEISLSQGTTIPTLGLSGEVMISGKKQSLWRHFIHMLRKVLRADLWL